MAGTYRGQFQNTGVASENANWWDNLQIGDTYRNSKGELHTVTEQGTSGIKQGGSLYSAEGLDTYFNETYLTPGNSKDFWSNEKKLTSGQIWDFREKQINSGQADPYAGRGGGGNDFFSSFTSTIGNYASNLGNSINKSADEDRGFYTTAAAVATGAYLATGATAGAAAATEAGSSTAWEASNLYGGSVSLGADLSTGTGVAAETLGTGAATPYSLGYYSNILSAAPATSEYAGTLGVNTAVDGSSSNWFSNLFSNFSSKGILETATAVKLLSNGQTQEAGKAIGGKIGDYLSQIPNISIGSSGSSPQLVPYGVSSDQKQTSSAAISPILLMGLVSAGVYFFLKARK